jgi:Uma2 family endonuclease
LLSTLMMKADTKYSYTDYQQWEGRWELIEGIPYNMSPALSNTYQRVSGNVFALFHRYLLDKPCEVRSAPFDVCLSEQDHDHDDPGTWNVVQPDISVICDQHKMDERGCKGAPDLVVEILSPGTVKRDRWDKFLLYEKYGVREYWIVDPIHEAIEVYLLQEKQRFGTQQVYTKGDVMEVSIFKDCSVDLHDVFHRTFPPE